NDDLGAVHTLVGALVWGIGTKARNVTRHLRLFAAADVPRKLGSSVRVMAADGPKRAYEVLSGENHVRYLGPAFFTKLLYFAGMHHCAGTLVPLILDDNVRIGMNALRWTSWPSTGWTASQYEEYLRVGNDWASQWAGGVAPDLIELALFEFGLER